MKRRILAFALSALALAACSDREEILEGDRLDILAADAALDPAGRTMATALPSAVVNTAWTHAGGGPAHSVRHPTLGSADQRLWTVDIGAGNSRRARLTADPLVAGGRVFVMDAAARVSAVGAGGQLVWTRELVPQGDRGSEASGGGMAIAGTAVYVTTGFGAVHRLDAADGALIWSHDLGAAASGAPTVAEGVVTVMTSDGRAIGIDARSGAVRWQVPGPEAPSELIGGVSPAFDAGRAILAFPGGQITAAAIGTGETLWSSVLIGRRAGTAFAAVADMVGDPVVSAGAVYTGTLSGRLAALETATGRRLWTVGDGVQSSPWVAGTGVFYLSDRNTLERRDAVTGAPVWSVELPGFRPVRRMNRLRAAFVHYGPVLAGGRLIVVSSDGLMRQFDPATGALISAVPLPGPAARPPVVAANTLFVVTEDGALHAFR